MHVQKGHVLHNGVFELAPFYCRSAHAAFFTRGARRVLLGCSAGAARRSHWSGFKPGRGGIYLANAALEAAFAAATIALTATLAGFLAAALASSALLLPLMAPSLPPSPPPPSPPPSLAPSALPLPPP